MSCTPDPFTDVTCAANPNDGKYVQKMKDIGITSGCGGGAYCPDAQTPRSQAAVFFLKGKHCALNVNNCTYTPPPCGSTHVFADVACPSQYADWVGEFYVEGITAGCGNNNFCPATPMGSWQMLAFANKIWASYAPLPRNAVLTYRDEGARVTTEANQTSSSGDASEVMVYPRDNVFLGSQLVASAVWSGTTPNYQFYAVDHLGTPRLVTNISAVSVETRKFWPYGDDAPSTSLATGLATGQQLQLAGIQRDSETEHYYDHARTEDFTIGRFLSPDLLRGGPDNPQSWHRYSYVLNNPMTLTDPFGFAASKTCDRKDENGDDIPESCNFTVDTFVGAHFIPADWHWAPNAAPNGSDTPIWGSFRNLEWHDLFRNLDAAYGRSPNNPGRPSQKSADKPCPDNAAEAESTNFATLWLRADHPMLATLPTAAFFVASAFHFSLIGPTLALCVEPLACGVAIFAAGSEASGGTVLFNAGVRSWKEVTLPALSHKGC